MSTLSVTEQVGAAHRWATAAHILLVGTVIFLALGYASDPLCSVSHSVTHFLWAVMAGLDSLAILQQELQRIGKNQLALRSAIDNDKAIVVHPSQQAMPVPPGLSACLALQCLHRRM